MLLLVGMFLDPNSAVILFTPLLWPIAQYAGVDLIHFGIIMTVNLAIGMFSPSFRARTAQRSGRAHARRRLCDAISVPREVAERVNGIEPSYAAWEAAVLPLNYTRYRVDFNSGIRQ